ncbi:TonB-dependent Receptor Plug Domain [Mucilaginibacter sp. OK268]|uniref:carboxypeptidase regulatory-like domain-containing protein n=1 Tax=Mucilaginibacter sp. OK268 TaxID=1881048 RepID=UPI00087E2753|nr:carboxypeptidase regulatory-like domain-containing protein [Mucilaginibacter sp. OK268]SDP95433.1 TonB-dependent Receptor Plug Domain [Mucilaginibacter sp. OK268]
MKILFAGFLLCLTLFSFNCLAQISISGKVLNQVDNKPVANASVFLSNATIGNKTEANGTFVLSNVKPGKYELVISIVGFETSDQPIIITTGDVKLPDIMITPKTMELKEVKVKAVDDKNRQLYLGWLKSEFLGNSDLARECKIINPELLDFDYDAGTNTLKASSVDFLVIQNMALGYNIKYLLANFVLNNQNWANKKMSYKGFALFEEMKGSPSDEKRWQKMRRQVYGNSSMHFLRSVINNKLNEEGFKVQRLSEGPNPERPTDSVINARVKLFSDIKSKTSKDRDSLTFWNKKSRLNKTALKLDDFSLSASDFGKKTDQEGLYALGCDKDALFITYSKNHHFDKKASVNNLIDPNSNASSLVEFTKAYAFFDNNGWIVNPDDVMLGGVWGRNRVAELLPADYEEDPSVNTKADSGLTNLVSRVEGFANNQFAEKTYLHLDRPNYLPGDTIWFKAYTVSGASHELSTLSNVLHAELINDKDSVIRRINLPMDDGLASGDFTLTRSLNPGTYRIRAYTNWMRNLGTDGFYDQPVNVGMQYRVVAPVKQDAMQKTDVQFFPEGGDLVMGLRSKVAIKVIGADGKGADVEGAIVDNEGTEVAFFSTQHLGMGVFAFTPQANKIYKAKVTIPGGTPFMVDLPKAKEEGFVLTVNNRRQDSITVKINAADKTMNASLHETYYLVAQSAGKVYYTTSFKLDNPIYQIGIEKDRFPSGITQFTLFTQKAEPLNERIAFIRTNDTLHLNATIADKKFAPRQKVTVNIDLKDPGSSGLGNFSVAVINETRAGVDEDAESTIFSNLLLTSELKGHIERPGYYFNNTTEKTEADLDVLMLTQGYRRFEWKKIFNEKPAPINFLAEKGLELTGTIKTPGGKPLPNGKVNLFSSRENVFKDTVTDASGHFMFKNLELSDTAKVVVQGRKQNDGKNVAIFIKQPDYPKVDKLVETGGTSGDRNLSADVSPVSQESYDAYIKQKKIDSLTKVNVLKEVVIKGKKGLKGDITNKYGTREERVVDMTKLRGPQFTSLQDGLFWLAPETHKFSIPPSVGRIKVESNDRVMIDGVFRDKEALGSYSPQEIESVHLVGSAPLIVVTTRRAAGTDTTVLKQVNIRSTKLNKKPDLGFSSNLNGAGNADQIFMGNKLMGCSRLSDCLNGKLLGVSFDYNGSPVNTRNKKEMSVIINGVVLSGEALNSIDYNDVYSIEVLRSASFISIYGSSMIGGALVITTKRGTQGFVTSESPTGVITYPYKGYYKARSFYSPKYDSGNGSSAPDLRTTIYWQDNVNTNASGKASFNYFNGDTKGIYRIVIEGINDAGNLGRQVLKYKVE